MDLEQSAPAKKSGWSEPKIFVVLLALISAAAIIWHATSGGTSGSGTAHQRSLPVSRTDYPGTWPLTVDGGDLWCDGGALTITVKSFSDSYSLNGAAETNRFNKPLDSIWADDPSSPGLKMSIAPLVAAAQKLC